jgi:hypothetical protein
VPIDLACIGVIDELEIRQMSDAEFEIQDGFTRYS